VTEVHELSDVGAAAFSYHVPRVPDRVKRKLCQLPSVSENADQGAVNPSTEVPAPSRRNTSTPPLVNDSSQ
jgi:hypothetical protein